MKRSMRHALMMYLALGILAIPFITPLMIPALCVALVITWGVVALGERVLVSVGVLDSPSLHEQAHLTQHEREAFAQIASQFSRQDEQPT